MSRSVDEMKAQADRFGSIINTVAANHDLNVYAGLLRLDRRPSAWWRARATTNRPTLIERRDTG